MAVADSATRQARNGDERLATQEVIETRASEPPGRVRASGGIAHDAYGARPADCAAPALGRLLRRVADRDPLCVGGTARRLAQHLHRQLRERAAGVAQECDDRRAAVLEGEGKARRALAGSWRRDDRQRVWREERPRIHGLNVTPLAAPDARALARLGGRATSELGSPRGRTEVARRQSLSRR